MTTISDLPVDLVSEILSRVPMTSLRSVRPACKKWNALSKNRIFGKTAAKRNQFLGFMMMDSKVCYLKVDLQGIRNDEGEDDLFDISIKQVSIFNQVEISKAFHCDGLVLCVINDNSKLLLWNPYLGQIKWIQPRNDFHMFDKFALGYDNNNNKSNHKILRIFDLYQSKNRVVGCEIYDLSSNSWRVLDDDVVTHVKKIPTHQRGVTLKGNAYFFAQGVRDDNNKESEEDFLLCFDFTSERFGERLSLPFRSREEETVTLYCVRDEQLAVLHQHWMTCAIMEIWVSNKIDKSVVVSWTKFLEVDMRQLIGFAVDPFCGSFFIDEDKRVAVVFDLDGIEETETCRNQTAYIIGVDGYLKSMNLGEAPNHGKPDKYGYTLLPLVCSSYVPSLVQLY